MNASVDPSTSILTVDLAAVIANYRTLAARVAPAVCSAVVKADAYGLGASRIAMALFDAGCRDFFVALLGEALDLRAVLGAEPRIYVLNGLIAGAEPHYLAADLLPVLNTLEQCRLWSTQGGHPAVLQVDSGMSRLGLSVSEQQALISDTGRLASLNLTLIMSHLANADVPDHPSNQMQLQAFRQAMARFPALPASLANSAGIFLSPDYHFNLCRPGAALYGIEAGPRIEGMVPIASFSARVAQLRTIEAGTSVGYGFNFTATQSMRIATIAVGYADGWPRSLSSKGAAWFNGNKLPILGNVSMDSFVVDISALADSSIAEGDLVELIGPQQTADDVGRMAGTIGYEIITRLGRRFQRVYTGHGQ